MNIVSFWTFFSECFIPLQKISIHLKPEHQRLCDELETAITVGHDGVEFYVINIPPRFGKTKILEALACWQWSWAPEAQMIYTGVSVDLVSSSVRYISDTLKSHWYQVLFPHTAVGSVCKADHVNTSTGGNLFGAGIGGTIIGKGAGLKYRGGGFLAIDDAAKPDEALSPVVAKSITDWFERGPLKRRNSVKETPIIICSQRLSTEDLPGYVLKNYPELTRLIKIPALRPDGTSIMEETVPAAKLKEWQRSEISMVRFDFASQYQQEPISYGGNLIPIDKFHRWDPRTENLKFERTMIVCDTALKTKQHSDSSCLQHWGYLNGKAYLTDSIHGKWASPQLLANATAFWRKHTTDRRQPIPRFIVEEKAAGTGLVQQLNQAGVPVRGIERNIDKVTRVKEVLPFIETGMVVLPVEGSAPYLQEMMMEYAAFREDGKSAHDDYCDCLADAVQQLLGRPLSIFDVLRKSQGTAPPKPTETLLPPPPEILRGPALQAWAYLLNKGGRCPVKELDQEVAPHGPALRARLASYGMLTEGEVVCFGPPVTVEDVL